MCTQCKSYSCCVLKLFNVFHLHPFSKGIWSTFTLEIDNPNLQIPTFLSFSEMIQINKFQKYENICNYKTYYRGSKLDNGTLYIF